MAGGWSKDGAEQEQIDNTVEDALQRVRSQIPAGDSRTACEACGAPIPEGRRRALPGVRLCVACQEARDADQQATSPYNRRASKDSQLR